MKPMLLLAASTLALTGLAACSSKPQVRAALDCPASQGELTRTAQTADGKSCTYVTQEGAEVALQLVSTGGNPERILKQIEAGLTPPMTDADRAAQAEPAKSVAVDAGGASASDAAAVARQAEADAGKPAEAAPEAPSGKTAAARVEIGKDGATVETKADGETTHVRLPGISITAGENSANVKVGGITVDADGDGDRVTVRRYDEVRLKGEALSPQRRGVRAMLVRRGEFGGGYRVVGYEAGGPKVGPITVATVRSKSDLDRHGGDIYDDIRALVRKNGGV
jgi:hypothetical protein